MKRNDPRFSVLGFLAVTLLVLGALLIFARYPAVFRTGNEFRAAFRSAAGLNRGSAVRYAGIPVGMVTGLDLDPANNTRVLVSFRVKRSTPVRADTKAAITQVGLLGEPYLELRSGRADAPLAVAGTMLGSVETPTLQEAVTRVALFLDRADTLVGSLRDLTAGAPLRHVDETLTRIDRMVASASGMVASANRGAADAFARVDRTSAELGRLADRSQRLIGSLDSMVHVAGPGITTTQREALAALQDLHTLIGGLQSALDQGGGAEQLVRNLSVATDNLARLTTRIERDPTSVFKKSSSPAKAVGPNP